MGFFYARSLTTGYETLAIVRYSGTDESNNMFLCRLCTARNLLPYRQKGSVQMKKIIKGKLYDTESAEMICEYSFSNPSDFKHVYEALYKSLNGQYFIEYSGGAMSKYSVQYAQNEVGGSNGIRLLSEEDARIFLEEHGTSDDYVRAFGEPELG